jgi:MFS family permease
VPAVVVVTLLFVAWAMTPAMVEFVARRRFPRLERRGGAAAWFHGVVWSLGCTVMAVLVLVLSLPLWLVPPLALVIPALVWGWLAAQVFAFDTLSAHATPQERRTLTHRHRLWLLLIGVISGLLGSVPSLVWAAGALTIVFAPVLAAVSVWLYTLVFAFASLWFAHFTLASLERLRAGAAAQAGSTAVIPGSSNSHGARLT